MLYLERNVCRKCPDNENEVNFGAHYLKYVKDFVSGVGMDTLKLVSHQKIGFDVVSKSFL